MLCCKFYPSTLAISSEQWTILSKTGIQAPQPCESSSNGGRWLGLWRNRTGGCCCAHLAFCVGAVLLCSYRNIPHNPVTWVSSNVSKSFSPTPFFFLKQCSYGCSSIWEASGTVHGNHEEEHLTLWGAAGEDVWLQLRSDGSWAVDAVNVRAFSVWHQNLPVSHRTHRKQTRQNRSCCCHRRCHCCG